jgi:hypothetical protein
MHKTNHISYIYQLKTIAICFTKKWSKIPKLVFVTLAPRKCDIFVLQVFMLLRYSIGPFPMILCRLDYLLKNAVIMKIIIYLDITLIIRCQFKPIKSKESMFPFWYVQLCFMPQFEI